MHPSKSIVATTLLALASARPMHEDQGATATTSWDKQVRALLKPFQPLNVSPSHQGVQGPYFIRVWDEANFASAVIGVAKNQLDGAYYAQAKSDLAGTDIFYSREPPLGYTNKNLMLGSEGGDLDQALLYPVIDNTVGTEGTAPVKFNTHPVSRVGPRGSRDVLHVPDQIDEGYTFGKFVDSNIGTGYIPVYHSTVSGGHGFALCADNNEVEKKMLHIVLSGTAGDHDCTAVELALKVANAQMGGFVAPPPRGSS